MTVNNSGIKVSGVAKLKDIGRYNLIAKLRTPANPQLSAVSAPCFEK